MKVKNEYLLFYENGRLDLDTCTLDVYEIIMQNTGGAQVSLLPAGMSPGGASGLASKQPNGIVLQPGERVRFYAGNIAPRADEFDIYFGGVTNPRLFVQLSGIQKNKRGGRGRLVGDSFKKY